VEDMALQHVSNFVVFYGLKSTRAVRPSVPSRSVICGGAAVRKLAVDFCSSASTAIRVPTSLGRQCVGYRTLDRESRWMAASRSAELTFPTLSGIWLVWKADVQRKSKGLAATHGSKGEEASNPGHPTEAAVGQSRLTAMLEGVRNCRSKAFARLMLNC